METADVPPVTFGFKDAGFQIIASVIAHSLAIHAGINMVFPTILMSQIMVYDAAILNDTVHDSFVGITTSNYLVVDQDQATWIASIAAITTPVGSLLSGPLMDRFGRRVVCSTTALALIFAWSITATATSHVYFLYTARALAGFGAGLSTVGLVYVSEISHASVRSMLLSLNSVFVSFGILLTILLGHLMAWKGVAWSCATLAFTSLVLIAFVPESPVWFNNILQNDGASRDARVLRSLKWLYRNPSTCKVEYDLLIESRRRNEVKQDILTVEELPEETLVNGEFNCNKESKHSKLRPIMLLLGLFLLQQFSGGYLVIFYAVQIFQKLSGETIDQWTSIIWMGVFRFAMAIVAVFLSRTVGRRKLLTASGIGMSVSMFCAAFALFIPSLNDATRQVLPIGSLLVFVWFSSLGFLIIPWTLIGELLPHRNRGKGSGIIISFAYVFMFITVKIFLYVVDFIGLDAIFLFFAITSVLAVVYVYLYIPETLGKTFEEIEKHF